MINWRLFLTGTVLSGVLALGPALGLDAGGVAFAQGATSTSTPAAPAAESAPVAPTGETPADAPAAPAPATEQLKELSRAEWQEEYQLLNQLVQRYDEGVQIFRKDVQSTIDRKKAEEIQRINRTYDERYDKLVEEVRLRREQAIAAFERFIQKYVQSEHTPLAMFRLAELYYEEGEYAYIAAQEEYSRKVREANERHSDEDIPQPKNDFRKSLALYDKIIKDFPDFKHIDGVYYMRGYLLGKEESDQYDPEGSRQAWEDLIRKRPDSIYASQAYLRIGEYYFEKEPSKPEDLVIAIDYYKRVMSYQDNWKDRALYKIAWTYYRLSDWKLAISNFIELMDYSQALYEETGQESDLRAEALEYLAISFSDYGTVEDALKYFEQIEDRPYKKEVLKKLAETYVAVAKFDEAIDTYSRLQELFPYNPENPLFQGEIIKIHNRPPVEPAALEASLAASEELIKRYAPDSEWAQKLNQNKGALLKAQELVQERLKNLAYHYHGEANSATRDADRLRNFNIAADKYREFLTRFPYAKEAFEMQFYFGDCLFYSGHFEEAALQYDKAMTYANPQHHADAARGMVESYEMLIQQKEGADGMERSFTTPVVEEAPQAATPEGEGAPAVSPADARYNEECLATVRPVPLSSLKKKYIDAIDIMARVAPNLDVTPSYLFKAASVYHYHKQFPESEKRYRGVIDSYPKMEISLRAAQLVVDGLVEKKSWDPVIGAVETLKGPFGPDTRAWNQTYSKLLDIQEKARPKAAFCIKDNPEEQIKRFCGLGTDFGYINCARLQEKLGRVDDALKTYQTLIQTFGNKSQFLEESLFRVATNYEKFLDLPKAIESYDRLVATFPRSEKSPICLYNMAFLYLGLKEFRKSARAYENYAINYSNQDDAEFAHFTAAKILLRIEDWNEVIRVFRDYIRRYQPPKTHADRMVEAHVRILEALEKLGKTKEALEWEKRIPAVVASLREMPTFSPYGINLYAGVMFREVPRMVDIFNAIEFKGNQIQQQKALERKSQLVSQIDTKVKEVVRLGDPEFATASFYYLGFSYHKFGDALSDSVPDDLDEESREIYEEMIGEYVEKLEDQALNWYKKNLELEETQNLWNDWIEKTYIQLNQLNPSEYPARKKERFDTILGEQPIQAPLFRELVSPSGT